MKSSNYVNNHVLPPNYHGLIPNYLKIINIAILILGILISNIVAFRFTPSFHAMLLYGILYILIISYYIIICGFYYSDRYLILLGNIILMFVMSILYIGFNFPGDVTGEMEYYYMDALYYIFRISEIVVFVQFFELLIAVVVVCINMGVILACKNIVNEFKRSTIDDYSFSSYCMFHFLKFVFFTIASLFKANDIAFVLFFIYFMVKELFIYFAYLQNYSLIRLKALFGLTLFSSVFWYLLYVCYFSHGDYAQNEINTITTHKYFFLTLIIMHFSLIIYLRKHFIQRKNIINTELNTGSCREN